MKKEKCPECQGKGKVHFFEGTFYNCLTCRGKRRLTKKEIKKNRANFLAASYKEKGVILFG